MDTIYLDNNASTAPDPLVIAAVSEAMASLPGNASSHHAFGFQAADAVERARGSVAGLVGARVRDVVFTSGATEANNLALIGLWEASRIDSPSRVRVLVGATEHPAVLEVADYLATRGALVHRVRVDSLGRLDLNDLKAHLTDDVLVVSVMAANNETGTLAPLPEVSDLAHSVGALVHSDCTQAMGRVSVDMTRDGLDFMSLSAHKMHGPKGVGALVVRRGVVVFPQLRGGGHERGLRSGTINTPGVVGLGVAAELAASRLGEAIAIRAMTDKFIAKLENTVPEVELNGHPDDRLPNTANLRFVGADAEAVMMGMPQVACSTGSACSAAVPTPSPVLLAMGKSQQHAAESLRFSLSRTTTHEELMTAADLVRDSVAYVRSQLGHEVA
ncbi:MAG: aminotransferase class V-fold PLP-dependent enzyme [Actinobacteria bacterium]|uniref:cysteine desulfurase n=1 Tax=freshwater metagenome TaxID=449393 RepID=A0A6J7KJ27_9ZZZZ|nr:aminotransferase class V-fold PLP-dependent enzyme [Actinomycetota bacterium]MSW79026.1 aminotransferase class V-fold PLP-dependent enzyme [Actinomycetota bacterium]MSX55310.1 aminotransferase class V-fold PLP-dependent enzyme [Actinomycetota bacterium]MSZ84717.1 aminotransferase class V-fold PLP-dependent enzyme [Actinomycetota bacterium]MTB19394.1 aminotransferase class V-fold PLP-dependent enzyme [Actinomycetota bacterium]